MENRLIATDDLMRHIKAEYNRRAVGTGLKLAWIEKAIADTPDADVDAWIEESRGDDRK